MLISRVVAHSMFSIYKVFRVYCFMQDFHYIGISAISILKHFKTVTYLFYVLFFFELEILMNLRSLRKHAHAIYRDFLCFKN